MSHKKIKVCILQMWLHSITSNCIQLHSMIWYNWRPSITFNYYIQIQPNYIASHLKCKLHWIKLNYFTEFKIHWDTFNFLCLASNYIQFSSNYIQTLSIVKNWLIWLKYHVTVTACNQLPSNTFNLGSIIF